MFTSFGDLLKSLRKHKRISQLDLAQKVGVHSHTISGWERGNNLPGSKGIVIELAHHLRLDEHETRQLLEASLTALSPYWQMPYQRNPFFTGREDVLHQLHHALRHEHTAILTQSYTLSGLGGVGKTQVAIEYAYRYSNSYSAIFWISAEMTESIVTSMVDVATLLNLSEKQDQDQEKVVAAVIRWLTNHCDWLLILDNVEEPALVKRFLPPARSGSLLFTSRRQSLGLEAQTLDLKQMTQEEGITLLLHRAKLHDRAATSLSRKDVAVAQAIVREMDGLPLALDQAGAYIELTRCSLSDYLQLFRSSHLHLLDERDAHMDHPLSVTRTFALTFEQIEQKNTLATDLLTVCAFLAPEAIPEAFFIEGTAYLGPTFEKLAVEPFQFQNALKALLAYSLIQRNAAARTVTIHRLVQVVLKERLTEEAQRIWTRRVIEAMCRHFPVDEGMQTDYWLVCEQLLPHAQICRLLGDQWSEDEVLRLPLMSHVATYLTKRARYTEAEPLFKQARHIGERALGEQHPLVAEILHELAELYQQQGKYAEAEPLFESAIRIREQALGTQHPLIATSLERLGNLYYRQGKYEQAEPLYQRALHIHEKAFGPEYPHLAYALNGLGNLYNEQGKYEQAELLYQRALHIWEKTLGPEHPQVAYPLNNLGNLYVKQDKYEQAESLYKRAFYIREHTLGSEHPLLAFPLNGLAMLYCKQGKYEQAEPLYQRALHIREQALGPEHPQLASPLTNLGELYKDQGKYKQAEPLYQRALHIQEKALGSEYPHLAYALIGLATLYREQDKYEQAKLCYQRALHIWEQALEPEHPQLVDPLNGLANLYREHGQYDQAKPLYQRALTILRQHQGLQHSEFAETLHHFALFHQKQQQIAEALSLYQQALTIREQALGPDHLKTIQTRTAYTQLLEEVKKEKVEERIILSFPPKEAVSDVSNEEALSVASGSPLPSCPSCQSTNRVIRKGVSRAGKQRFWCHACRHYFTPEAQKRGHDPSLKLQALTLAQKGISARAIAQHLKIHHSTVSLWMKEHH